ncbi:MAG: hypothetical protein EA377_12220 [Phycisphaerales bacterium]|nr:MAG: hypothetical protein EA377_12220 [Phycisphaerales bacterium]
MNSTIQAGELKMAMSEINHRADSSSSKGGFEKTLREKAQEAAEQFVASSLVIPILATLRENTFNATGPFAPNMAEKRFGPVFDQHVADRVVKAANFPIVDTIADRYAARFEESEAAPVARMDLQG